MIYHTITNQVESISSKDVQIEKFNIFIHYPCWNIRIFLFLILTTYYYVIPIITTKSQGIRILLCPSPQ